MSAAGDTMKSEEEQNLSTTDNNKGSLQSGMRSGRNDGSVERKSSMSLQDSDDMSSGRSGQSMDRSRSIAAAAATDSGLSVEETQRNTEEEEEEQADGVKHDRESTVDSRPTPGSKLNGSGIVKDSNAMRSDVSSTSRSRRSASNSANEVDEGAKESGLLLPPRVITTTTPVLPESSAGAQSQTSKPKVPPLRRGKWTVEEEAYVARVIQDFNSGFLDAPAGTTLRTYLSEKLQCDPMRITKKFTGDACIGKRVFHPAVRSPTNAAAIDKAQAELEQLERRWRRRLANQQRESAKKAAASAAAATVGRTSSTSGTRETVVTRTASWLDRAKSALKEPSTENERSTDEETDIQSQMQEVERLIHEGPIIQQTSVGLPLMMEPSGKESQEELSNEESESKRLRTAEDAEALVGFLRSVRASAASGQGI